MVRLRTTEALLPDPEGDGDFLDRPLRCCLGLGVEGERRGGRSVVVEEEEGGGGGGVGLAAPLPGGGVGPRELPASDIHEKEK